MKNIIRYWALFLCFFCSFCGEIVHPGTCSYLGLKEARADTKISAMTDATTALSTDAWHIARSGADYKLTMAETQFFNLGNNIGVTDSTLKDSAFGIGAGTSLTTGNESTAIGYNALNSAVSTNLNTGVGAFAAYRTVGVGNTAVGAESLYTVQTNGYDNNTAIGYNAAHTFDAGSQNTFLGANADTTSGTRTNMTVLGYGATNTTNNSFQFGNTSVTHWNFGNSVITLDNSLGSTFGSPTGGAEGAGTLNLAGNLYVNGVQAVLQSMSGDCTITTGNVITCTKFDGIVVSNKTAVKAATTANLNATYVNGTSGVGATLTNAGSLAAFSTDGVSPSSGDRLLVKNQSTGAQNGCYTVTVVGSGAVAWVLTRCTDYDQAAEMEEGDSFFVEEGTTLAETGWIMTQSSAITVGTTALTFAQGVSQSYVSDAASDTTTWPMLAGSQTGAQSPLTDSGLTYNASTDTLTVTNISAALGSSTATTQSTGDNSTKVATTAYVDTRNQELRFAISDQTTTVTAANGVYDQYPFDTAVTMVSAHADCKTAPTGTMTIDINEDGTTMMATTKLTIDANENSSYTAANAAVFSDTAFAAGARLSVDIDSTTGGVACEVFITYHK